MSFWGLVCEFLGSRIYESNMPKFGGDMLSMKASKSGRLHKGLIFSG